MMEKGKLYRVNDYAVSDKSDFGAENRRIVRDHGYLWIYEGLMAEDTDEDEEEDVEEEDEPFLRSVATGHVQWFFLTELEAVDAGEG